MTTQQSENGNGQNRPITVIQTPRGESYGTTHETPEEARRRLSTVFLVQRIGNVIRCVRKL